MTTTQNPEDYRADLINEWVALEADMKPLLDRRAEIEEELRALPADKYDAGAYTLTVIPNTRFDRKRFETDFPSDEYPGLYRPAPPVLKTDAIDEAVKAEYTNTYANKISIK